MKLINREWNTHQQAHADTWLADTAAEITSSFDPECAAGSMIIVIPTKDVYIKNCSGCWQKFGTAEVIF